MYPLKKGNRLILTHHQLLPPDSEVRRKHETLLLDKLYDMGILSVCL
jgi:hypothetical protein